MLAFSGSATRRKLAQRDAPGRGGLYARTVEFALVTGGMIAFIVLVLVVLGRAYPGSGADLLDWKPTRDYETEVQLEQDDIAQMLAAQNRYRRRRGAPELTERDAERMAQEDNRARKGARGADQASVAELEDELRERSAEARLSLGAGAAPRLRLLRPRGWVESCSIAAGRYAAPAVRPRDSRRSPPTESSRPRPIPTRSARSPELLGDVTVVAWLFSGAATDPGRLESLNGERLGSLLAALVDTPVRGFIYEALPAGAGAAADPGRALVEDAESRWRIPTRIVAAERSQPDAWGAAVADAVGAVVGL